MTKAERQVIRQALLFAEAVQDKSASTGDISARSYCVLFACRRLVESRKRHKKRAQKTVSTARKLPVPDYVRSIPKYL